MHISKGNLGWFPLGNRNQVLSQLERLFPSELSSNNSTISKTVQYWATSTYGGRIFPLAKEITGLSICITYWLNRILDRTMNLKMYSRAFIALKSWSVIPHFSALSTYVFKTLVSFLCKHTQKKHTDYNDAHREFQLLSLQENDVSNQYLPSCKTN